MKKKLFAWLSIILLIAGVLTGIYVILDIYFLKKSTPPGACPVTADRPLIYTAIILGTVSFILSFFEKKDGNN